MEHRDSPCGGVYRDQHRRSFPNSRGIAGKVVEDFRLQDLKLTLNL